MKQYTVKQTGHAHLLKDTSSCHCLRFCEAIQRNMARSFSTSLLHFPIKYFTNLNMSS